MLTQQFSRFKQLLIILFKFYNYGRIIKNIEEYKALSPFLSNCSARTQKQSPNSISPNLVMSIAQDDRVTRQKINGICIVDRKVIILFQVVVFQERKLHQRDRLLLHLLLTWFILIIIFHFHHSARQSF